jgi:hypothetical protein
MRKLIYAIILLLAIYFAFGQAAEIQAIGETLQKGDWRFIILGLALQAVWFLNVAYSYQLIFQAVGIQEGITKVMLLSNAALFINIVAPSVGVGGMAVFISEARRRGYSTGRVTVAGVLYLLYDYAAVLSLLAAGFIVLLRRNNLTPAEISAAAVLVLIAAALAILLAVGMRSERALASLLAWLAGAVNRLARPFIQRAYLSEERARTFAHDAAEGLRALRRQPKVLLPPFLTALSSKILLLSILTCCYLIFKVPFSAGTIIAGFSIGYLFLIISPTPAGIGVVEGVMTLVLRSLFTPLEAAVLITLVYRGFTFWLPFVMGLASFRLLVRIGEVDEIQDPGRWTESKPLRTRS